MANLLNNEITSNVPNAWISTHENYITKGKNAEIWDSSGKRYLDYVGGYAVLNTGHLHPRVVKKVSEQLENFSHSCFAYAPHENAVKVCNELNNRYPIKNNTKTFLVNSGAEAVENAVKIARYSTGRKSIISFNGGFHGRTYLAMGLTGKDKPYKQGFGPFPDFVHHTEYPYEYRGISDDIAIEKLDSYLDTILNPNDVAAIVIEIQLGEGGYIPASKTFIKHLRNVCDKNGILLIFDEVMSGFRVGLGGAQAIYQIQPDLTALGKVIGGGLPVGAFGGKQPVMDQLAPLGPIYQAGTLSGNPLAMSAGIALIETLIKKNPFDELEKASSEVMAHTKDLMNKKGIPFSTASIGGMFGFFFAEHLPINFEDVVQSDDKMFKKFFYAALDRGIYFAPSKYEAGFISSTHDQSVIDLTKNKIEEAIKEL